MTPKQQRFLNAYLVEPNATKAATKAGYSKKTAQEQGSRLLSNAMIAAAIAKAREKASEVAGITAAWVLQEQRSLYTQAKPSNEETARKTLRDIGEHLGMYVERVESTNHHVTYVVESPPKFGDAEWQQRYSQLQ